MQLFCSFETSCKFEIIKKINKQYIMSKKKKDQGINSTWDTQTYNIPQHNKGYIWQTQSDHNTQWWNVESLPLRTRTRQGCSL